MQVGETVQYGDYMITLATYSPSHPIHHKFGVRSLLVRKTDESPYDAKPVEHFHFLDWPKNGTPNNPEDLGDFVWQVYLHLQFEPGAVIHCSAGQGRSGTFMAVLATLMAINNYLTGDSTDSAFFYTNALSLLPAIQMMRKQRHPWMVKGKHQLALAYKTLHEVLSKYFKYENFSEQNSDIF